MFLPQILIKINPQEKMKLLKYYEKLLNSPYVRAICCTCTYLCGKHTGPSTHSAVTKQRNKMGHKQLLHYMNYLGADHLGRAV
jgi:hypothetical protein